MHRRFTMVLRSMLLTAILAGMFGQPQSAQAHSLTSVRPGVSSVVTKSQLETLDQASASDAPEVASVQDAAAPLIRGPITVSAENSSSSAFDINFIDHNMADTTAYLLDVDPYTVPGFPVSDFNGGLTIEPITAYNLVVDSNILSPSSYGPSAATIGAEFCNTGGAPLTNVWAYVGDYNADNDSTAGEAGDLTPGTYPVHNQTTDPAFNTLFPHLAAAPTQVDYGDPARFYALEQESGSSSDSVDASRYIGDLAAGECRTEYWLVSYPRKALIGGSWVDVTGGVKPEDDLWLSYFFWATSNATGANPSYIWNPVTMRNEISAMANKIWPNGDNKVPDEYIAAIQQALGWDTWTPNGSGTTAYPGETVTSQGIWYDLGNVGAGFDNNGDFVPDRNIWVQPIGDAGAYDPGCFRLVRTYGLVIVKLNDGTEMLIPFVDQMYFESIPDNNNGAVGLVFYEYVALDGACTAGLTPYQEVASGYDNEKFNADFGAGIPPLQSQQTNMTFDKNGQTSIALGGTIDYTMTFTLPDVDITAGNTMAITVGNPSLGMPLTYYETVPDGLWYVAGSASDYVTMMNYPSGTVPATRLWSTNSGATWSETEPPADTLSSAPNNLVIIQWRLDQAITSPATGPAVTGQVSFSARVPAATYTATVVNNTSCLKYGNAECFLEDTHTTLVTGTARIEGTVWRDDATGGGVLGNGIQDGAETGIGDGADADSTGVTVNLYWDANGDGDHTDAGDFLYTTTTSDASGNYSFTGLPATSGSARYLIEANASDADIPQGYGPTTATAYTGISLAAGGIYGDAANEPSDFGFAPALDVDKRVDTVGTIMVGDTIRYTVAVSNTLPGSGANSAMCEYSIWAGSESTVGNPTTGSGNSAWQNMPYAIGRPDSRFSTTIMSNSTDIVGLNGFNMGQQAGAITSVKYVVYMKEVVDFGDDEFIVRIFYNSAAAPIRTDTYLNATLSSPIGTVYELEQDITSLRTWTWADFQNNLTEMQIEGNRIGGSSGDAGMDAAGFIITTDQPCGEAGSVLNPVPLTDTFDDNYFDFISANPPVSSSGTGTLTWNNVGPLYPGQTRYITVYMRAAQVGASPATVNTATSTNSKFANGLPANSPESDTASVTIAASTDNRMLAGTVFDDNSSPLNGWSGAAWTVGGSQTGMDAGDTGIQYIPVDLYGCVEIATGNLVVGAGNGQSCAAEGGEWRLMRTTSTDASGNYSFTSLARGYYYAAVRSSLISGSQTADVNQNGICTTCDSRSNDPAGNGGAEDLEDATFVGNLDNAITSITRVNFGYNVPGGTYNIGDFLFYDWDGDGIQDASDEPMGGVTVRLLAADGSPLASTVTLADGSYLFTGRPSGYYTVQVETSTLPAGVVQTKDPDAAMDNQSTFALTADDLTRDFAYQPTGSGSIGDTVWRDTNGDGSQSSSEPGIPGVTVILQVDLNGDGTYVDIASATTDASGHYLFPELPQGTYRVAVDTTSAALPNDAFGNNYLPSTGTTAGNFVYQTRTLPTSTSVDLTADFGFAPPASIGDTVYYDLNGNGTQDFTEAGMNGVTLTLYIFTDANGNRRYDPGETLSAPVDSVTTATVNGKTGFYQFDGLVPGNYVVQVTPPANTTLTGDPNMDGVPCTAGEPLCDHRDGMRLYNGTNYTGADFGYQPLGVIGDTLWIDTDADGVRDLSEQGIADVTVRLCSDAACGTVVQSTTADPDGHYSFGSVPDGTYYVSVHTGDTDFPPGLTVTFNDANDTVVDNVTRVVVSGGVVIEVGDDADPACTNCSLDVDFGYRYVGSIDLSGTVCLENASPNGVCGGTGSGVGANESAYVNVVVYLYLWNDDGDLLVEPHEVTQIASVQTEADGDYSFENIPGGFYYVVALGAPQDDIQLTTTQASLGAPTTQVHETTDNDGDTISAYQVVQVAATNIENRDFAFETGPLDYGDLPSTYSTRINDSPAGPSHTVPPSPNLYLGANPPDAETNGSPTADATGDGADEDGVALVGVWGNGAYNAVNGTGGAVDVTVSGSGYLAGWIDFNRDGDFTDAGEMILHQAVSTGTANYTFDIPADTFAGPGDPADLTLYARFRLFESEPLFPSIAYSGAAGDGEVEDYAFHWAMTVDKDTATPTVTPTGTVIYLVALVNWGDETLTSLQATDILPDFNGAAAGKGYTVLDVAATGGMTVNFPGFDGDTDPNLLAAGNSLPAGNSRAITITLTLNGAVAATYDNTVTVSSAQTGTFDDDGTTAQDAGTPPGSDLEVDEDVTVGSNGSLVIVKNTLPDDAQDFAYTVSGTGLTPFTLDDDAGADATYLNSQTFNGLATGGTYTVTETAVAGWSVTNISCAGATSSTVTVGAAGGFEAGDTAVSVVLAAGETVTCTFENTATLSVVTTKTAGDTSIPESGQSVTYIVAVENTSPVEVTLDSLTDNIFSDITTTGHDNVTATTCATGGVIAPGATYTCAFAATISGTFPGTHVNTVTAQVSNGSNTASDGDDETITFEEALPALTVVKSSSAGGTVHAGDAITYTITITNSGNVTQNNIVVSDPQPAGTAYVSFSSLATGYIIGTARTYLDQFGAAQFNNSNGTAAWGGTPWIETGDNGIANSGKIQINTSTAGVADFQATAPTDVLTLTRPVNLTNAASATLTYSIAENGINSAADTALVQVWNGTAWTTVATYTGDFASAAGNVNILAYANADTQIRFVVTGFDGGTQNLVLDNVQVQFTAAAAIAKDNNPFGGVSGSLINGSPPTLLFAGDSFDLLPGQSMTVSYQATVNNPVPSGQTQVVNTASVTSAEIATPIVATVTDNILTAALTVMKTASPTTVPETGGSVTFTYQVRNTGTVPVTITSLTDDIFGALTGDADCQVGTVLAATATCDFTTNQNLSGAAGSTHTNVFTAHAEDSSSNDTSDTDDAVVTFTDMLPAITVTKTANPTSVPETGGSVTFTYQVTNTGPVQVTITSLDDDIFGALTGDADCQVGTVLASTATCDFTANQNLSGAAGTTHTNVFTAHAEDDDANDTSDTDDAVVTFSSAGSLTIIKDSLPDDAQDFAFTTAAPLTAFTLDDDADGTLPNAQTFTGLAAGSYAVAETPAAGWTLTNITCSAPVQIGTDADFDLGDTNVSVNLAAGQNITCTFTNTRLISLTLQKTWVNAIVNDAVDVTATVGGVTIDNLSSTANTANETDTDLTPVNVTAGQVLTFDETFTTGNAANYTSSLACTGAVDTDLSDGLTVNAADIAIVCTETNTRVNATLTLQKTWVNAVTGDTATVSMDGINDDSLSSTADSANETDVDSTPVMVYAGETVTISETLDAGNTGFYIGTLACTGAADTNLADGLAVDPADVAIVCTETNTRQTATLTLQKTVVNNNGGTAADTDWTLAATGPSTISGTEGQAAITGATVPTGTYTLSEVGGPAGYTAGMWSCDGADSNPNDGLVLAVGETVTCTITNNDDVPSLTLNKIVINDNGGTAVESDWTLTAMGPTTLSGAGASGNADVVSGVDFLAGTYTLSESGPAGYTASVWTCTNGITVTGGQIALGLGQITVCSITNNDNAPVAATLSDYVWNDVDADGIQDTGESGIAGVTVRLLDGGGTEVAATTTNASGLYGFTVPAGTYRVDFVPPAGYVFSPANQGADDAADSDANDTTGETGNYTLAAGETNDTVDAGMYQLGTISGHLYVDTNGNGTQDAGEPDLANVNVVVTDSTGTAQSVSTDANGDWTASVPPGNTSANVDEADPQYPTGYTQTEGDDPTTVTVVAGTDTDAGNDGYYQAGTVSGHLYIDTNGNGTQDAGEPDLADVNVVVTDANGTVQTVFTNANGDWTATVPPGTTSANVDETDPQYPTGYTQTEGTDPTTVTAVAGTDTNAGTDGYHLPAILTLEKVVRNDHGGTALDTAWTLTATGPSTISGTEGDPAITSASVLPGTYTLSESGGPGGYTPDAWVCAGAADLDPNDGLALAAGETVTCTITNNDLPASIGNYVWNDADGGGDQDEAAAGLENVTINVYLDDGDGTFEPGAGDTLAGTDVTDGAGAYNVTGLSAGRYFVDVVGPAGYTLTTANDPLFVVLTPGQNYTLADFGYQQTNATISDYIWNDINGDGLQAGESGLGAGIRVYVDSNNNDTYDIGEPNDLTDAAGLYAITGLAAGTYSVRVENPPAGYLQTYDLDGLATANEAAVTVAAGELRWDVDFGYQAENPALTVEKSSTTTGLSAPGTVPYRYVVTNIGNVTLTGISLSDNNDNDDMDCPATTLAPAGSMTCTAAHTFTQAELDSNGSPTAASGVLANTVTASSNEAPAVTDNLDIPITQSPAVNIDKTPAAQTVISGDTATFTLTVTNTGNVTLTGVIVTDAQCTGLPVYTGGDANSDGRLQFTETWTFLCSTINVMSNFTNTASVSTTQGATDSDSASVTVVVPQADLELTKLVSSAAPNVATDITFTLNIVNRGPDTANGVMVTDVIPTGFTYISDDGGGAYNPATGVWTVGSLADDESSSLTITVRVNLSGSYVNYAQVTSSSLVDPDSTPDDDSTDEDDDDSVTVTPAQGDPDGLTKSVVDSNEASTTHPEVAIGEIVTYRVNVNVPPGIFTNARLVDTMGRGLSYMDCVEIIPNGLETSNIDGFTAVCADATVDNAGGTTTVDIGRRVTFDFGTLTNDTGSDQTLEIVYRAVVLDNAENVSGVNLRNSAQWTWGASGSLGPAATTVRVAEPDLSIVKTASTSTVSVGSEITITLTIRHTADSETNAFDVVVLDELPAELQYVPGSLECISGAQPADVTCVETGGTITAQWSNFLLGGGDGRVTFRVTVLSVPPIGIVNIANVAWTSLPGDVSLPQNPNVFSTERDYDPGNQIDVYGANSTLMLGATSTGGSGNRPSTTRLLPATGFAPNRVTDLSNVPPEVYTAANGVTVEIPALGVKLPVVGVPLKDGTWNVSWLGSQAGWLEGSAFPSWNGNSVLTGHVYLSNGLPGPFVDLNKLKFGDKIIVHAYGQKYTFEVRTNAIVEPNDQSGLKHEEKPWLTLITCKEYEEKTNTYRKRVVVRAVLVSVVWE